MRMILMGQLELRQDIIMSVSGTAYVLFYKRLHRPVSTLPATTSATMTGELDAQPGASDASDEDALLLAALRLSQAAASASDLAPVEDVVAAGGVSEGGRKDQDVADPLEVDLNSPSESKTDQPAQVDPMAVSDLRQQMLRDLDTTMKDLEARTSPVWYAALERLSSQLG